tara:strand:+ start:711 stop:1766 length:1056 start_codon:yes stop_codon:yes gene_type:complete
MASNSVGGMFGKPKLKLTTAQKLQGLGALLRDAGDMGLGRNNDHFGRFQSGAQDQMAQAQQQQYIAQATQGMSQRQKAAFMLNPNLAAQTIFNNANQSPLAVTASQQAQQRIDNQAKQFGVTSGQGQQRIDSQNAQYQQGFVYQQERDNVMDGRYADQTGYDRNRDASNDAWRQREANRNQSNVDRGFGEQVRTSNLNYGLNKSKIQAALDSKNDYTPAEIKDYRQKADGLTQVGATLKNYYDLLEEKGKRALPFGADVAQLESAYTAALMDAKNLYELGALSGPDLELIQSAVPKPTGIMHNDKKALAKLKETYSYLERARNSMPEQYQPNIPSIDGDDEYEAERKRRGL